MKSDKRISPPVAILGMLLVGFVFVSLFGQTVRAQQSNTLTPPFKFVEKAQPRASSVSLVPPGSTVIVTETFGVSFAPTVTLTGSTPAWRVYVNPDDTAHYYWGRVGNTSPITFTPGAWTAAVQATSGLPLLTPGTDPYPGGQDTWLIYGPIDLSHFQYVQLGFEYFLDSAAGDKLSWSYSTDGQTFYGNSQSATSRQWITNSVSFPLNWVSSSNQTVYIAFAFKSGSTPAGLGAFIRDVKLTAEPIKYVYLPLVLNNYPPTPTPTPTPTATPDLALFKYTFDTGNIDLNTWGGYFVGTGSGGGGSYEYGQCMPGQCDFASVAHGNPLNSLRLYTTAFWLIRASSPNVLAPTNYDLYVDISPWRLYPSNNLYGVIFNASSDTFRPQFNFNGQFYYVYFSTDSSTGPIAIRLDRCSGGSCTRLSGNTQNDGYIALPPGLVIGNAAGWDTLHILRDGQLIEIFVNGQLLISANDLNNVGPGKFGVFIFPSDGNDTTYPPIGNQMQVDFDNIKVYGR